MSETTTPTNDTPAPEREGAASTPTAYTASEALDALNAMDEARSKPAKTEGEQGNSSAGTTSEGEGSAATTTTTDTNTTQTEGGENAAPVIQDLSSLPEGAKVKVGDVEVAVSDILGLNSRDTALTQRATAMQAQEDKLTAAIKANRDQMKSVTDAATARFQTFSDNYEEARRRFAQDPEGLTRYETQLREAYADMTASKERYDALDVEAKGRDETEFKGRLETMAKYLMDPATGIAGYNQERHDANAKFAASMGVPEAALGDLTDGPSWRLVDMARRFSEGTEAAAKARATPATKSANPAIRGTGDNGTPTTEKAEKAKKAESKFAGSRSQKDAIALLDTLTN